MILMIVSGSMIIVVFAMAPGRFTIVDVLRCLKPTAIVTVRSLMHLGFVEGIVQLMLTKMVFAMMLMTALAFTTTVVSVMDQGPSSNVDAKMEGAPTLRLAIMTRV